MDSAGKSTILVEPEPGIITTKSIFSANIYIIRSIDGSCYSEIPSHIELETIGWCRPSSDAEDIIWIQTHIDCKCPTSMK